MDPLCPFLCICATAYKYAISVFELQGLSLVKCVGMLTIRSYSKSHVLIFSAVLAISIKEKDKYFRGRHEK